MAAARYSPPTQLVVNNSPVVLFFHHLRVPNHCVHRGNRQPCNNQWPVLCPFNSMKPLPQRTCRTMGPWTVSLSCWHAYGHRIISKVQEKQSQESNLRDNISQPMVN